MAEIACSTCGRNLGDDRFFAQGDLCLACAAEVPAAPEAVDITEEQS